MNALFLALSWSATLRWGHLKRWIAYLSLDAQLVFLVCCHWWAWACQGSHCTIMHVSTTLSWWAWTCQGSCYTIMRVSTTLSLMGMGVPGSRCTVMYVSTTLSLMGVGMPGFTLYNHACWHHVVTDGNPLVLEIVLRTMSCPICNAGSFLHARRQLPASDQHAPVADWETVPFGVAENHALTSFFLYQAANITGSPFILAGTHLLHN